MKVGKHAIGVIIRSPVNQRQEPTLTNVTVKWLFVSLTVRRIALHFSISVVIGFSVKTLIPRLRAGTNNKETRYAQSCCWTELIVSLTDVSVMSCIYSSHDENLDMLVV